MYCSIEIESIKAVAWGITHLLILGLWYSARSYKYTETICKCRGAVLWGKEDDDPQKSSVFGSVWHFLSADVSWRDRGDVRLGLQLSTCKRVHNNIEST